MQQFGFECWLIQKNYLFLSPDAFLQLRSDDSERLLAPKNDAHVEGAESHDHDWDGVRHEQDQDIVAETKKISSWFILRSAHFA